jgi:hypothetical protein
VAAFLNPDVEEEIYIQAPQVLEVPVEFKKGAPDLRLLKGLQGLKQVPRLWNYPVNATLYRLNCTRCNSDPCLYVRKEKSELGDDLILTCNSSDLLFKVRELSKTITK